MSRQKTGLFEVPFATCLGRVSGGGRKEEENEHGSGIRKLFGDLLVHDDLYILFITSCGLMG